MPEEDTYKTINAPSKGYFRDRGSKFHAFAFPIESEEDVKEKLQRLRKEYYDARHHCYAYILGKDKESYRINDDGEPSGSAGKPIYGQLLSYGLTNCLVVVIRYFGGVKLGIPGLINAYRTATIEALEESEIITKIVYDEYEIVYPYELMNPVMRIIKEDKLEQTLTDFALNCRIKFKVRQQESDKTFQKFKKLHKLEIKHLGSL